MKYHVTDIPFKDMCYIMSDIYTLEVQDETKNSI